MSELQLRPPPSSSDLLGAAHPSPFDDGDPLPKHLSHYTWMLRRHAWEIGLFVAVCVTATYVVSKRMTPLYQSTAVIDVDWQAPAAVIGQDATRNGTPSDAGQFLATQMRLVQSDAVLRPVAEKYHLVEQEQRTGASADSRVSRAPTNLARLTVTRPLDTYLINISYTAPDPQQAADVANGVAQSYLDTAFQLHLRSSENLTRFMEQQLSELKSKVEYSSQALARLEGDLNVVNPEDRTNILSSRLLQFNAEYTSAQADRIRKESALKDFRDGSITSAQSGPTDQIHRSVDDARRRFAVVKSTFGQNHPEYKKVASELAELEGQLGTAETSVAQRIQADYDQALSREQMLGRTVAEIKSEYDTLSARLYVFKERKREADSDRQLYEELTTKIKEAGINSGFQSSVIRIADYAKPAALPIAPMIRTNVALAFFFSALLGIAVVFVRDAMDTSVRDPDKLRRYLGIDVLGLLPIVRRMADQHVLGASQPRLALTGKTTPTRGHKVMLRFRPKPGVYSTMSEYAESIRTLRSTILLSDSGSGLRTILITSADPGEGKTTTAVNLAIAHAAQGNKTLIIDADLRRPSVHRRLGLPESPGLSEVLTRGVAWRDTVVTVDAIPGLHVMPAGEPSYRAADVIGPPMRALFGEIGSQHDLVVIDAPSLRGLADPLHIATIADGVLIVAEAGATRFDAVSQVVSMLARVRANVIGMALNRVRLDSSGGSANHVAYVRTTTAG